MNVTLPYPFDQYSGDLPELIGCDLCGNLRNIDHDASQAAGLWICGECVENTLQGACHE